MPLHSAARSKIPPDKDAGEYRVFRDPPGPYVIEEFRQHIRKTGQPETFPGIDRGPLDPKLSFQKLCSFEVSRKKRPEGDMAACPMCHRPDKYLNGSLIFITERQSIAAIGNQCADNEMLAEADRNFRAKQAQDFQEIFLLANLPLVPMRLSALEGIRPIAESARTVFRSFRNKAPTVHKILRDMNKTGGKLLVSERIDHGVTEFGPSGFRGTGSLSTRDISYGLINGSTAVIANYDPIGEIERIIRLLDRNRNCRTEEAALEFIVRLSNAERNHTTTEIQEADKAFKRFRDRLLDFVEFFSRDNIDRINHWAAHPEHPFPFKITLVPVRGGTVVTLRGGDEYFRATIQKPSKQELSWPSAN